jgi:hypothetical protein
MTREELFKFLWALVITEGILREGEPFEWMKSRTKMAQRRKTLLEDIAYYADKLQKESEEYHRAKVVGMFEGDFVEWLKVRALWIETSRWKEWERDFRAALRWLDSLHWGTLAAMKRRKGKELEEANRLWEIAKEKDESWAD